MAGENIIHVGGIRMRVTGVGNLQSTLFSLDEVSSQDLVNLSLSVTTDRQPTVLANFLSQRVKLRIKTTEINERVKVQRIIIFKKPVAQSYPQ